MSKREICNLYLYKLPELLQCGNTQYENWEVKLYKKNIKEYKTTVKGLKIIERLCTTEVLGSKNTGKTTKHNMHNTRLNQKFTTPKRL